MLCVVVGLVVAEPEDLRRGEAGQRAVAGEFDQPLEPDRAPRSRRTRLACAGRSRGSRGGSRRRSRRARRGRASDRIARCRRGRRLFVRGSRGRSRWRATSPRGPARTSRAVAWTAGRALPRWRVRSPSGAIARPLVALRADVDAEQDAHVSKLCNKRGGCGRWRGRLSVVLQCPADSAPNPTARLAIRGAWEETCNMSTFLPERRRSLAIAAIVAAKQNGNITRRQLHELGLDDSAIALPGQDRPAVPRVPRRVLGRPARGHATRASRAPPCSPAGRARLSATARR